MTSRERLSNVQIVIMRSLWKRGGHCSPVSLKKWKREFAVSLWRRGLVRVFSEQLPEVGSARSPLYMLTINGAQLASTLFPAPRGFSGAEETT